MKKGKRKKCIWFFLFKKEKYLQNYPLPCCTVTKNAQLKMRGSGALIVFADMAKNGILMVLVWCIVSVEDHEQEVGRYLNFPTKIAPPPHRCPFLTKSKKKIVATMLVKRHALVARENRLQICAKQRTPISELCWETCNLVAMVRHATGPLSLAAALPDKTKALNCKPKLRKYVVACLV